MKIVDCKKTRITGRLLRSMVPDSLKDKCMLINLGSRARTMDWLDYDVINDIGGVRNCSDKIRMFQILKEYGVKCLDFYLKKPCRFGVYRDKYVFKKGRRIVVGRGCRDYDYCTKFEEKDKEWRVVIYKGKVLRAMEKINYDGSDVWKQKNCDFRHVNDRELSIDVRRECIDACNALGIDLAGIDVLRNKMGVVKIIEVNSGMAMGERTIGRLFRAIEMEVGVR